MSSMRSMGTTAKRMLLWSLPAGATIVFLLVAWRADPELVDIAVVVRRPMVVTLDQEGETRVHDVFTVSAPIAGRLLRTPLHVGDTVELGKTIVARIEPSDPGLLDPRRQAEAEAAIRAAEAASSQGRAERARALAEKEFASAEVLRMRELRAKGVVSQQAIEGAERSDRAAAAALAAADAAVMVREHELAKARTALIRTFPDSNDPGECGCAELTSPVSGQVLAIRELSETIVQPGTALLDIGDPAQLEVVADYLSVDAVMIQAGQRALIENWGGAPLAAIVLRVEPSAFTKVSALGIAEQRVNVIMDVVDPRTKWPTLGHGYRVDARVITWESDGVVVVPLTALFRQDDVWAVFLDDDGTAARRNVRIGHRSGLDVEVLEGLVPGDRVVVNPSQRIEDGSRIRAR
jgi:HlyD family secretion protein